MIEALGQYLFSNGYPEAASLLRNGQTVKSENLNKNNNTNLSHICESYKMCEAFYTGSLDLFHEEYRTLFWSLYLRIFTYLIHSNNFEEAQNFLQSCCSLHSSTHEMEISQLQQISSRQKLSILKKSKSRKPLLYSLVFNQQDETVVEISEPAFFILIDFLLENTLTDIMSMLAKLSVKLTKTKAIFSLGKRKKDDAEKKAMLELISSNKPSSKEILWGIPYELENLYAQDIERHKEEKNSTLFRLRKSTTNLLYSHLYTEEAAKEHMKKNTSAKEASQATVDPSQDILDAKSVYVNLMAPKSDTQYFATICANLIDPLLIQRRDTVQTISFDDMNKLQGSVKQVSKRVPISSPGREIDQTWPSLCNLKLQTEERTLCADVEFESSIRGTVCTGMENSVVKVFEVLKGRSFKAETTGKIIKREISSLVGHSSPVYGVSVGRGGRKILSADSNGRIYLWAKFTQSTTRFHQLDQTGTSWLRAVEWSSTKTDNQYPVWDVNFGPLGNYFTICTSFEVNLFSIERNECLGFMQGHESHVNTAKFHPNSHYILSGSEDRAIKLWDIRSKDCVQTYFGHLAGVNLLAFDPSGRYFLSVGDSCWVLVWDMVSGKVLSRIKCPGNVSSLSVSPDGMFTVIGTEDGFINVVEMSTIWCFQPSSNELKDITCPIKPYKSGVSPSSRRSSRRARDLSSGNVGEECARTYFDEPSRIDHLSFLSDKVVVSLNI
eukprot:maker-scaffold_2-snap-gene-7.22-mRNA-1 protein AED:0.00 eAED:0.00 QI:38/1/1/1/1/1/2/17/721